MCSVLTRSLTVFGGTSLSFAVVLLSVFYVLFYFFCYFVCVLFCFVNVVPVVACCRGVFGQVGTASNWAAMSSVVLHCLAVGTCLLCVILRNSC